MNSSPPVAGSLDSGASFSGMTLGNGSIASQASFSGSMNDSMHGSGSESRPGSRMSMSINCNNGPSSSQSQNGGGTKSNGMTTSPSAPTTSDEFQGFGAGDIVPPVPPPSQLMLDSTFSPEQALDFSMSAATLAWEHQPAYDSN